MKIVTFENFKDIDVNNVDWESLSRNYFLSEDFIREFQNKVEWIWISNNQTKELAR